MSGSQDFSRGLDLDDFGGFRSSFQSSNDVESDANDICRAQQLGECIICFGSYHDGELVGSSGNPQCQHEFHRDCIAGWLMIQDECPCCRQRFLVKEQE